VTPTDPDDETFDEALERVVVEVMVTLGTLLVVAFVGGWIAQLIFH
jgi:hypothetical protein